MDIWIKLSLPDGALAIGAIYRQWRTKDGEDSDLTAFLQRAELAASSYRRLIVAGDFNLDPLKKNDTSYYNSAMASRLSDSMDASGFAYAGPFVPTYYSHGVYMTQNGSKARRQSTIDLVYTAGCAAEVEVLPNAASDHRPVIASVSLTRPRSRLTWVTRRNFKRVTPQSLAPAINTEQLDRVYGLSDVNAILDVIVTELTAALDLVAPEKSICIKKGRAPLYLAKDTLKAMEKRDQAARAGNKAAYRTLRNKAGRLVKRDRMKSTLEYISDSEPARIWSLAKSITGDGSNALPSSMTASSGEKVTGDVNLAMNMNEYFDGKIKKLLKSIPSTPQFMLPMSRDDSVTFAAPDANGIRKIIMGLNNTHSVGPDGIPVRVLKAGAYLLSAPLAHLVRVSFESAIFPAAFKLATVVPIHKGKGKDKESPDSYRPVALLDALSKVLEKAALASLQPYMEKTLPDCQHGFRLGRSAATAVSFAHGSIAEAKANGRVTAVAGFDLSAAFDTVDKDILLSKLEKVGVKGTAGMWLRSYLTGRQQRVLYNDSHSSFQPVDTGVPQGSILGPLLFLALLIDLPLAIGVGEDASPIGRGTVGYADDCVVWVCGKDTETVKDEMEAAASAIVSYMASNKLVLNPTKTQVLWAGTSQPASIKIGSATVPPADVIEMLGIKFNKSLSFNPFLAAQASATRRIAGIVGRMSTVLPRTHLATVAKSLVTGKLGYGAAAAGCPRLESGVSDGSHTAIQTAVNDVARAVLRVRRSDRVPVKSLLSKSGLPSFNSIVVKAVALEAWRAISQHSPNPTSLGKLTFQANHSERLTRASEAQKVKPKCRFRLETFTSHAVNVWNSASSLRGAPTVHAARQVARQLAGNCPL